MKDRDHWRKLDVEIAEGIFGFMTIRNAESGELWGAYPKEQGLYDWKPVPHYSTDIASAMEVFQKLRESHRWCCLTISSDYHYVWDVRLTPSELDKEAMMREHKPTICVSGESLPEVICKAAIRTLAVNP